MAVEELIRACAELSDSAAWGEFIARFHRDISLSIIRTVRRWGFSPKEVLDDLIQDTYLKLCADKCRLLYDFAIAHPEAINGYVKTIAINVAHDYFKSQHSRKRGGRSVVQADEELEPKARTDGLGGPEAMERNILLRQINDYLHSCTEGPSQERDRMVFWFHYRQGMTAKEIATLPATRLTVKGVESLILRITRCIGAQMRRSREGYRFVPNPSAEIE
jgi:RNA polymerase sigma-70 factor (ECF subfamily)